MEREITPNLKINRTLALLIGLLVGSLILNRTYAQELDNSLLWEVKGKGIETSYVYGTFHLLPQEDFELKEKVTKAFDGSDQIVMELDMDNPNMQLELMKNVAMKEGQTMDQLLDADDYQNLDAYLQKNVGMGLAQMNTFKPFFIASMLFPTLIEGKPASYEITFMQRALDGKKEIMGLETPTEQANVFDKIAYADQVEDLLDMIYQQESIENLFGQMIDHYKQENISEMYDLMVEYMDGENEEQYLLIDRNKQWIPKIGEYSKERSTFYAVGAGHLGGDNGVINLLKAAGYKVKPVK